MGFMESMKAANMNFGKVDSPDFQACYIAQKGDHFMITGAQAGTYEFYKEDVICFKPLSTGDDWIKWLIKFKDGKYAIITSDVTPPSQRSSGSSMAPIERFFGDLLFSGDSGNNINNKKFTTDSLEVQKEHQTIESVTKVEKTKQKIVTIEKVNHKTDAATKAEEVGTYTDTPEKNVEVECENETVDNQETEAVPNLTEDTLGSNISETTAQLNKYIKVIKRIYFFVCIATLLLAIVFPVIALIVSKGNVVYFGEFILYFFPFAIISLVMSLIKQKNKVRQLFILSLFLLIAFAALGASIGVGIDTISWANDYENYDNYQKVIYKDKGEYVAVESVSSNDYYVEIESTYNNKPVKSIECSIDYDLYFNGSLEQWLEIEFKTPESNPSYFGRDVILVSEIYTTCLTENSVIEIPSTIVKINPYTFYNYTNLNKVLISDSVTSLGDDAFRGCYSLEEINITSNISYIGSDAFSGCTNLTILCELNSEYIGWDSNWNSDNVQIMWNKYILIQNGLYFKMENGEAVLQEFINNSFSEEPIYVEIPSTVEKNGNSFSVTTIKTKSFYLCDNLTVFIPSSVTAIETEAFYKCSNLKLCCEVETEPTNWDYNWFLNSDYYNTVYWGVYSVIPNIIKGNKEFVVINGEAILNFIGDNIECIIIPSTIEVEGQNYSVTTIKTNSLYDCETVAYIYIPSSVTTVENHAFNSCDNLIIYCEAESIPEGWDLNWLDYYYMAPSVVYWGVDSVILNIEENDFNFSIINGEAFLVKYTGAKKEVVIPNSIEVNGDMYVVKHIGSKAFNYCEFLTKITLPNSLLTIDTEAFCNCSSLTSIVIPEGVISLGEDPFYGCSRLTIYCEVASKPSGWDSWWNYSNRPVYWAGQWEYDADGNPVPLS